MKKAIGAIFVLTIILLFVTNSMYVDWAEIGIIIGSISIISITYNLFLKTNQKYNQIIRSSALIGLLLSCMFSLIDLVVDHYKIIQGVPDGRFLTLGETISEFSNELLLIVPIVMCSATLISFVGTAIYSKFFRKIA